MKSIIAKVLTEIMLDIIVLDSYKDANHMNFIENNCIITYLSAA